MSLHQLVRSLRGNSGDEITLSVELTRELEDLRKFYLNLLMTFLTVNAISASNALGTTTLALVVYTINLHIAVNTRFLQDSPMLSKILHAVPLLGVFGMAVFKLVIVVNSPTIAAAVLLVCALPPFIAAVHLAKRYVEMISVPLPVQMQDITSAMPNPAATAIISS